MQKGARTDSHQPLLCSDGDVPCLHPGRQCCTCPCPLWYQCCPPPVLYVGVLLVDCYRGNLPVPEGGQGLGSEGCTMAGAQNWAHSVVYVIIIIQIAAPL